MEENNTYDPLTSEEYPLLLDSTWLIRNKEVRTFVQDFLAQRVPEYFTTIPAATKKEHHMESCHGPGGLLRHTLSIIVVLMDIVNLEYLQLKQLDKDLIISAAILHDTFKHGKEGKKYERSHPNIAAQEILKFAKERNQEKIGKIIGGLVVAHMGEWGNQKPGNRGQFLVHLGDYLGSRQYLAIDFEPLREAIRKRQEEELSK